MKIFGDHEKNLSLYESITRSRKRSIFFYFILTGVFIIFLIFCVCEGINLWYLYATFGLLTVGFTALTVFTWYYIYKYPKKVTIFEDILEDYKSNKIIKELTKRGLKREKLDCVISPYRYIRIAYIYSEEIYYEIRIETTRHGYSTELTPKFAMAYPKKDIVRYFRHFIGKFKYEDNYKGMTKNQFYAWCYQIFTNEEIAKEIKEELEIFNKYMEDKIIVPEDKTNEIESKEND